MRVVFRDVSYDMDGAFFRQRLDYYWSEDTRGIVAYDDETGEFLAGSIFDRWTTNSCFAAHVVEKPMVLRHGFWEESFTYGFVKADRGTMYATVRSDNAKSLKLTSHMGFKLVASLPDYFMDGVHAEIFMMKREDCRWLEENQDGR